MILWYIQPHENPILLLAKLKLIIYHQMGGIVVKSINKEKTSKAKVNKNTKKKTVKKNARITTKSGHKLTPQQEMFCQFYAGDREFFGNGVQSYIEAYQPDQSKPNWYRTARSRASELLTKPNILERIDEIFEAHGLNDQFVDKQLEKLIVQDADFSTKMKAIAEYNKLKARITEKKDITSGGKKLDMPVALVEFVDGDTKVACKTTK